MKKKILVVAANHWTSPYQVGSHELTKQFIQDGWEVGFISDPLSIFHLLKINNNNIAERFRIYKKDGELFFGEQLWTYVPFSFLTPQNYPILRSKILFKNWINLTTPNMIKKIKEAGFADVDLIYLDSIIQSTIVERINYKKSVFRIADNNSGFNKFSKASALMEEKLASKADLVVYSAKTLEEYISRYKINDTLFLPNGVDFKNFFNGPKDLPEEFTSIPVPRVIYVGSMEDWFDVDVINYASARLPNVSFVFIGNHEKLKRNIIPNKNIYLLGSRPYNQISKYLYNSDIGIIPFNVKEYSTLINYVNPLKLYQYLACKLPVVASRWDELTTIDSPALLYNSKDEFVHKIKYVLNSNIDKEVLVNFARKNDWQERYNTLVNYLNLQ